MLRPLDEKVFVSGQIFGADMPELAAAGVTMIVNNRSDGEAPGQPPSSEIAAAASAAGIDYRHIPVAGGLTPSLVEQMSDAIAATDGKVLAFCTSGTRSTYLWALVRAASGAGANEIIAAAAAAGYDIAALRPHLDRP